MSYEYGERLNELLVPDDARQFGVHCVDCGSQRVVYHITVPTIGFPLGAYCLSCLSKRSLRAHLIPVPMEINLRDAVQHEIEAVAGKGRRVLVMPGLNLSP